MKPYLKSTSSGKLFIDTKHPEWKKFFEVEVKRMSHYKIVDGKLCKSN